MGIDQYDEAYASLLVQCIENADYEKWNREYEQYLEMHRLEDGTYEGVNLNGYDFSNIKMKELFPEKNFFDSSPVFNLSYARLQKAKFRDIDLALFNFEHARLAGALFDGGNIREVFFNHADLSGAYLKNLTCSDAERKPFTGILRTLQSVNFNGAILCNVNFEKMRIIRVNFDNANLKKVTFFGSAMKDVSMRRATVLESIFEACWWPSGGFSQNSLRIQEKYKDAVCLWYHPEYSDRDVNSLPRTASDGAVYYSFHDWGSIDFSYSEFCDTNWRYAAFDGANFSFTNFESCCLDGASFIASDFSGAFFNTTSLRNSNFSYAKINDQTTILGDHEKILGEYTRFLGVNISAIKAEPGTISVIKKFLRKQQWTTWYQYHKILKWFAMIFWLISDYGSSIRRILYSLILLNVVFTGVYLTLSYLGLDVAQIISSDCDLLLVFIQTTLVAFGVCNLDITSMDPIVTVCICVHVLFGYLILAALVTRLAVMFDAMSP